MDARPTSVRLGKVSSFFGVLFLVLGLLQSEAGAWGSGSWKNDSGQAPGQAKKAAAPAVAGDPLASVGASGGNCGSYCSTSDGTPSANGNGSGGGGRPCAGCVGNADNKNPPGQYKDGSDHNNGYECDGNNGIAKGNPAHSGCQTTTTVPKTTTTVPQQTTTTVPQQTTTTVPQQTTTTVPQQTTTTVAQETTTTTAPAATTTTVVVGGNTTTTAGTDVLGVQFGREQPRGFALTGAGLFRPLTLLGALLLLVGVALMTIKLSPQARA